jgi:predicted NUDIX family phosphoesterase
MSKMDEVILVVEREKLFGSKDQLAFDGILTSDEAVNYLAELIEENFTTMRRGDAEENPAYKQLIPYVVVRQGDKIFTYKRLSAGGEERLHGKISIGVGGHMNQLEDDTLPFGLVLIENLERELDEELDIKTDTIAITISSMINDDRDEVGKVHFGILVIADLDENATVEVKETDQLEGKWYTVDELKENLENLESWSMIALNVL